MSISDVFTVLNLPEPPNSLPSATEKAIVALGMSDGRTPTPKERHSGTTEEEAERRQRPLHAGLKPKHFIWKEHGSSRLRASLRLSEQVRGYSWLRSIRYKMRRTQTHNLCSKKTCVTHRREREIPRFLLTYVFGTRWFFNPV